MIRSLVTGQLDHSEKRADRELWSITIVDRSEKTRSEAYVA
jgi:hypothetical protein